MVRNLVAMAGALLLAAGPAAARQPVGWGDVLGFEAVENAPRSYYPELSDTEYESLDPGPIFYTYLPEFWAAERPPVEDDFDAPAPVVAADEDIRHQEVLLDTFQETSLLAATVMDLGRSGNAVAAELLSRRLPVMDERTLKIDTLRALSLLDAEAPEAAMKLLNDPAPRVRAAAVRLLAAQSPSSADRLLAHLEAETDPLVRRVAWDALAGVSVVPAARWRTLLDDNSADLRAIAVRGLLAAGGAESGRLSERLEDPSVEVRAALASELVAAPALAADLLPRLAADEHALVRRAVAASIGVLASPDLRTTLQSLAADSAPGVRREVATQLRRFPAASTYQVLVDLTGDPHSLLVRQAAAASLEAVADQAPMEAILDQALRRDNRDIRLWSYRLCARLGTDNHNTLIRTQFARERRPDNRAAAIRALAIGGDRQADDLILGAAADDAAVVRVAVAEAIGQLDIEAGYDILHRYATEDTERDVRQAALAAIGRVDTDHFADTLLNVLKQVSSLRGIASVDDRVRACWCASRLREVPDPLARRLADHVRTAVVATEMGREMDSLAVRASAAFALAVAGKLNDDADLLELAENCGAVLSQPMKMQGQLMEPAEADINYANQILDFIAGSPLKREDTGTRTYRFDFARIEPRKRL